MVKKLLHTRYRVSDLEKTVAFYRDVLGLELTRRHTSPRGSQLVFFKAPGSEEEIEICKFDESGPVQVGPDLTHLAFEVDDLEAFGQARQGRQEDLDGARLWSRRATRAERLRTVVVVLPAESLDLSRDVDRLSRWHGLLFLHRPQSFLAGGR